VGFGGRVGERVGDVFEEEHFEGDRQRDVDDADRGQHDQTHLERGSEWREVIPHEEDCREGRSDDDDRPTEIVPRIRGWNDHDQRSWDINEERVSVNAEVLHEGQLDFEVFAGSPDEQGHDDEIAIDCACARGDFGEVVLPFRALALDGLAHPVGEVAGGGHQEHDRGGDPKRTRKSRRRVDELEEVLAQRIKGLEDPNDHVLGVDIKERSIIPNLIEFIILRGCRSFNVGAGLLLIEDEISFNRIV